MTDSEAALGAGPTLTEVTRPRPARPAAGEAERLRAGDRQAMAEVFSTHVDVIYNYCYRRTGSWSAAEDLASTVFLEVWRTRRRAVEVDGTVLPWLYGVATKRLPQPPPRPAARRPRAVPPAADRRGHGPRR